MKVVTGMEMQKIDKKAILDFNIKGITLMENAGKKVTDEVIKNFPDNLKKGVVIFSGKGNNGGDGFVVASLLEKKKINVKVFLVCKKEEISGDAKTSLNNLLKSTTNKKILKEISSFKDTEGLKDELKNCGLIIDALLGTGFKGSATGLVGRIIDIINDSKTQIVSIDVPSGVNADTGQVIGSAIKASLTITLGFTKTGLLLYPGVNYAGMVITVDIGIPQEILREKVGYEMTEIRDIKNSLPKRDPNAHKGTVGRVLVIAGSDNYTGAACLTAMACLRSGAGLVTLGVPISISSIFKTKLTEVIVVALPETKSKSIGLDAEKQVLELAKGYDCIAMGPGLGRERETMQLVKNLIMHSHIPIVLDADGINAISGNTDILKNRRDIIITPHIGEFSRLIHFTTENVQSDKIEITKNFAQKYRCTVVLKGSHTIISAADGSVAINSSGNAGMATAGSGDVLTGIISALKAAGLNSFNSGVVGTYVHGLAGDLAKEEKGEFGLIAGDILENVPKAILKIQQS